MIPQNDVTQYSIGEIEIMVYDEKEVGTSHSDKVEKELKQVRDKLGVETSIRLLSKLDRYFEEYLPDFYKSYPYHS